MNNGNNPVSGKQLAQPASWEERRQKLECERLERELLRARLPLWKRGTFWLAVVPGFVAVVTLGAQLVTGYFANMAQLAKLEGLEAKREAVEAAKDRKRAGEDRAEAAKELTEIKDAREAIQAKKSELAAEERSLSKQSRSIMREQEMVQKKRLALEEELVRLEVARSQARVDESVDRLLATRYSNNPWGDETARLMEALNLADETVLTSLRERLAESAGAEDLLMRGVLFQCLYRRTAAEEDREALFNLAAHAVKSEATDKDIAALFGRVFDFRAVNQNPSRGEGLGWKGEDWIALVNFILESSAAAGSRTARVAAILQALSDAGVDYQTRLFFLSAYNQRQDWCLKLLEVEANVAASTPTSDNWSGRNVFAWDCAFRFLSFLDPPLCLVLGSEFLASDSPRSEDSEFAVIGTIDSLVASLQIAKQWVDSEAMSLPGGISASSWREWRALHGDVVAASKLANMPAWLDMSASFRSR